MDFLKWLEMSVCLYRLKLNPTAKSGFTFCFKNKIHLKTIAYFAFSTKGIGILSSGPPANTLRNVGNISLLAGYQLLKGKKFNTNIYCGVSYGQQRYRAEYLGRTHSSGFGIEHDVYNDIGSNYMGINAQLSQSLLWKYVAIECFIFGNYKTHPEAGLGLNFLVGRLQ